VEVATLTKSKPEIVPFTVDFVTGICSNTDGSGSTLEMVE